MSKNNPPDPNEYLRLLLQLQQTQQQQGQAGTAPQAGAVPLPPPLQHIHNNAVPANPAALARLGNLLAGLSPNTGTSAGEASAPAFAAPNAHSTSAPNPSPLLASNASGSIDTIQQQQLLIASAQLLVNVNPQLAAAAMEQAMSLASQSNSTSAQREPVVSDALSIHSQKKLYQSILY